MLNGRRAGGPRFKWATFLLFFLPIFIFGFFSLVRFLTPIARWATNEMRTVLPESLCSVKVVQRVSGCFPSIDSGSTGIAVLLFFLLLLLLALVIYRGPRNDQSSSHLGSAVCVSCSGSNKWRIERKKKMPGVKDLLAAAALAADHHGASHQPPPPPPPPLPPPLDDEGTFLIPLGRILYFEILSATKRQTDGRTAKSSLTTPVAQSFRPKLAAGQSASTSGPPLFSFFLLGRFSAR